LLGLQFKVHDLQLPFSKLSGGGRRRGYRFTLISNALAHIELDRIGGWRSYGHRRTHP
jgi:hypothetical protein